MAAPIFVEPGPFFEVLKAVMRTKNKYIGLLLTKDEDQDLSKVEFKDLYKVGVLGKIFKDSSDGAGGCSNCSKHGETSQGHQTRQNL